MLASRRSTPDPVAAESQTRDGIPVSDRSTRGATSKYISLIVDLNQRQMAGADLREHLIDLLDTLAVGRIRSIDDVQQES